MSNPLTADMLTATDQIYLSLWNQICSLDLLPGEKLSEVRLAAEFECSRVPVREALHRLAADGASTYQNYLGQYVDGISQLAEGTDTLDDGVTALNENSGKLVSGASSLQNGLEQLNSAL